MITENKLDVRTITMGISLRDCAHPNIEQFCRNVYEKITGSAEFLVKTGEDIEAQYGIPIIHKRISVTPVAIAAEACKTDSYVPVAEALDRAAKAVGVNFIGGFSALVEKGFTNGDKILLDSIPQALAGTDLVCSSVNLGSTKAGINMDCVRQMDGDKLIVKFENTGKGLTTYRQPITGFEIAGEDHVFHPAKVRYTKDLKGLELTSPDVPKPVAARYDFVNYAKGCMFNSLGMPLSSFRTDNWEK